MPKKEEIAAAAMPPKVVGVSDRRLENREPEIDQETLSGARASLSAADWARREADASYQDDEWDDVDLPTTGLHRAMDKVYLLSRVRVWRRMTQTDVAEALRRRQPAIARLERGLSDPKLSTVEAYAGALNVRVELVDEQGVILNAGDPRLNMTAEAPRSDRQSPRAVLARVRRDAPLIQQVLHEREEVEIRASMAAAQRIARGDVAGSIRTELKAALGDLPELDADDFTPTRLREFRSADRRLHLAIAACTGQDDTIAAMRSLQDRFEALVDEFEPCHPGQQRPMHTNLVDAIFEGNERGAAAATRAILAATRQGFGEQLMHDLDQTRPITEGLIDVRVRSECLAAELAAERRSDDDRARLAEALDDLMALPDVPPDGLTPEDAERFRDADRRFHVAIAAASNDEDVRQLAERSHHSVVELLRGIEPSLHGFSDQKRQHQAIFDAIQEEKRGEAVEAMRAHIEATRKGIDQTLAQEREMLDLITRALRDSQVRQPVASGSSAGAP